MKIKRFPKFVLKVLKQKNGESEYDNKFVFLALLSDISNVCGKLYEDFTN